MKNSLIHVILALLSFAVGCLLVYKSLLTPTEALVQIECNLGQGCRFKNTGNVRLSACAGLSFSNNNQVHRTSMACSEMLDPDQSSPWIPVHLSDSSTSALGWCLMLGTCRPELVDNRIKDQGFVFPWGTLSLILIVGTSVWVYFDARKRQTIKPKPLGWAIGVAGLWVIGMPWYLLDRAFSNKAQLPKAS